MNINILIGYNISYLCPYFLSLKSVTSSSMEIEVNNIRILNNNQEFNFQENSQLLLLKLSSYKKKQIASHLAIPTPLSVLGLLPIAPPIYLHKTASAQLRRAARRFCAHHTACAAPQPRALVSPLAQIGVMVGAGVTRGLMIAGL